MGCTANHSSIFDFLANELTLSIIKELGLEDFRRFRLVCRRFALLTRPLLALESFQGSSEHDCALRLAHLSQVAECGSRIRYVRCFLCRSRSMEHDRTGRDVTIGRLDVPGLGHERAPALPGERQAASEATVSKNQLLEQIMMALDRLPNLTDVCFIWCPGSPLRVALRKWQTAGLQRRQAHLTLRPNAETLKPYREDDALEHPSLVVESLLKLGVRLDCLVFEPLILDYVDPTLWMNSPAFSYIRYLKLEIFLFEEDQTLQKLDIMLSGMPRLYDLRLAIASSSEKAEFLLTNTFSALHSFHLTGALVNLANLSQFLVRHAENLERLHLEDLTGLTPPPPVEDEAAPVPRRWDDIVFLIKHNFRQLKEVYFEGTFQLYNGPSLITPSNSTEWRYSRSMRPNSDGLAAYLLDDGAYPESAFDERL